MSRGRKLTKAEKRRRRQLAVRNAPDPEADEGTELLEDLVCSHATAVNAAGMCDARLADLDTDLTFARLAGCLWHASDGGSAQPLGAALADLADECQRHREVLEQIAQRLDALATDDSLHDHLDPAVVGPALERALRSSEPAPPDEATAR